MNGWMDGSSRVFILNLMHDDDRIQRHVTTPVNYRGDEMFGR
jgi:hypothetical protein